MPLSKTYDPKSLEAKHYTEWEKNNFFSPDKNNSIETYTIVIPPPNVTGSLHMGHALNNTIQDILIRYKRMRGFKTLWQPGTDHAGIATQMVVERMINEEGISKESLGREKFINKIWEWKDKSGNTIINQLKRLGSSADWSRERFTMDEGLSKSVTKVFVDLYKDGLIYKDNRLVNWDPKLLTAISDLEVENKEVEGHLWYIKYRLYESKNFITIATTRPETMLGDSAIAVNPNDNRYRNLIGKYAVVPIIEKKIKIISDEYVDPDNGTGALKVTPAHDFNDFEIGKRHRLEIINIFDEHAVLNKNCPKDFQGIERFEARKKIIDYLKMLKAIEKIDKITHTLPFGDRSGVIIEPRITDQWYVDAKTLAKPAIDAVKDGKVKFVPSNWSKTFFEWMENIEPWCVSRQLWWGHQIPAWYGPDGKYFIEYSEEIANESAKKFYGKEVFLKRDQDVLDTWFSSALWPFSTLGWPVDTKETKIHYPTSTLVTGFDIIFFWVARMMMMGIHFLKTPPFKDVYVHALVRDEDGKKMSKSKGNVIDPLDLIDQFGADALRFCLSSMAAQGRDVKLSISRVEGYRNFATKLWNSVRFCELNESFLNTNFNPKNCKNVINKWIVYKTNLTIEGVSKSIEEYKFNEASNVLYSFIWHIFCDWYIELIKPSLYDKGSQDNLESRNCSAWVLKIILHLLHPFMPFITEELWEKFSKNPLKDSNEKLIISSWPNSFVSKNYIDANEEVNWLIDIVTQIRSVRSELNISQNLEIDAYFYSKDTLMNNYFDNSKSSIEKLAKLSKISKIENENVNGVKIIIKKCILFLLISNTVNVAQEIERIKKVMDKNQIEINKVDNKLSNEKFLLNAPTNIINKQKNILAKLEENQEKMKISLAKLSELKL